MQGFRSHIARLLLLVFGFILIPNELIHQFYGHDDTHCNPGKLVSIEEQHTHCAILRLESRVFTAPPLVFILPPVSGTVFFFDSAAVLASQVLQLYADPRAPPLT
jgi:hypothetical protein